MTTRLSRERAVTAALDHLHTPATELARFASKTPVDADPASTVRNPSSAARRARSRVRRSRRTTSSPPRWRSFAVLGAVLLTGFSGATLAGSTSISSDPPKPNSVLNFGAAPTLGSGPDLPLREGVVAMASDPAGPGYWLAAADGYCTGLKK